MGSSQSSLKFNPDTNKRSRSSKLPPTHYNRLVIFSENTVNQVAYLLNYLPRTGLETISAKLKIFFDMVNGEPVIGLAGDEINPENVTIEKNRSFFLWYIVSGKIEFQGEEQQLQQPIPRVASGAEVTIQYVPSTKKITLTVANPGKDSLSESITLTNLPSNQLLPFVGAIDTGNSTAEFKLLESGIMDHTNNSMIDVSHKMLFTASFGVVDISRDRKSITRTSVQQGNGCALLPIKLMSGVHRWGFIVRCDFGASLCLGLVRYPFMLSEDYLKDHVKHIYRHPGLLVYRSYRGLLYQDGKQLQESLDPLGWQHGKSVEIEFIFDSSGGTLEIIRNGRSMGIAFRGLRGIFQPMVGFYAAYEKDVGLKHYLTTETSVEMTVQSAPSSLEANNSSSLSLRSQAKLDSKISVGFEKALIHGSINITPDGKTLYREKKQSGNAVCLLNTRFTKYGTYSLSFIIEYDHGASTCLGVTQAISLSEMKISDVGNVYGSTSLYLYRSFQGMLYFKGKEQAQRLEEFWMSGTLVEMEIKINENDKCSVSFKVNATDQGEVFSDLEKPLTPLIAFYAGMEKRITLLHYEYTPSQSKSDPETPPPTIETPLSLQTDTGLNNVDTDRTNAASALLPILCTSDNATMYYPCCMKCEQVNDVIALPCKHSTVCAKDLTVGINAPSRHCMVCDSKITQVWNILQKSLSSSSSKQLL